MIITIIKLISIITKINLIINKNERKVEKEKNAKINEKKKKDESEAQVVYSKNILLTKYNYYVILFIITYHKYIFFFI